MRKLTALLTAIILMVTFSGAVYAVPVYTQNSIRVYDNSEYDFTVTEQDGDNNTIVRIYERPKNTSAAAMSITPLNTTFDQDNRARTTELLSALGMDDAFIAKLSDEDLQGYAQSSQIVSAISYTKTDENGNVTNVTAEEAENAAELYSVTLPPHVKDDGTTGGTGDGATFIDSYMEITVVVAYWGSARYRFTIDAEWLTDPFYTLTDSIGICAQDMAVQNGTRSGWYSFTEVETVSNVSTSNSNTVNLSHFYTVTNGSWEGSAATVDLKSTYIHNPEMGDDRTTYTDHLVHFQFDALVRQDEEALNFNVVGTYEHSKVYIWPDVSIGISSTGGAVSIGFDLITSKDTRNVEFDNSFRYVPD